MAALGFAGTVVFTSVVAIRDDVEGRPFGIRVPLSVRAGVLTGWGPGLRLLGQWRWRSPSPQMELADVRQRCGQVAYACFLQSQALPAC